MFGNTPKRNHLSSPISQAEWGKRTWARLKPNKFAASVTWMISGPEWPFYSSLEPSTVSLFQARSSNSHALRILVSSTPPTLKRHDCWISPILCENVTNLNFSMSEFQMNSEKIRELSSRICFEHIGSDEFWQNFGLIKIRMIRSLARRISKRWCAPRPPEPSFPCRQPSLFPRSPAGASRSAWRTRPRSASGWTGCRRPYRMPLGSPHPTVFSKLSRLPRWHILTGREKTCLGYSIMVQQKHN